MDYFDTDQSDNLRSEGEALSPDQVIIMAPVGRDSRLLQQILAGEKIGSTICSEAADIGRLVQAGVGVLLFTDEALSNDVGKALLVLIENQPVWSDLPIIVLGNRYWDRWSRTEPFRTIAAGSSLTLLERPVHPPTLLSIVRTSLQARRRQRELHEMLNRLSFQASLLENVNDAVIASDLSLNVTSWNRAAERMYGWSKQEAVGRHIDALISSDVSDDERERAIHALVEEGRYASEATVWNRHGEQIQVESVAVPFRDDSGEIIGFIAANRDISDRALAEKALRESEARFRGTFENAAVGIGHVDSDGAWLRVNQTLCRIVGYERSELLQKTFQEITHPDDLEADKAQFQRLLAGEIESYTMEKRYFHQEGHIVWINLTAAVQRDENGDVLFSIATVEDINERVSSQEQLREYAHTLELLNEVNASLTAELDLEIAVQGLTDVTRELCGADFALFLPNRKPGDAGETHTYIGSGDWPRLSETANREAGAEDLERFFESGGPVRIVDDVQDGFRAESLIAFRGVDPSFRSYLAIPVIRRDGYLIGGLLFGHRKADAFSPEAERLIIGLAAQAAASIDNARLYTELRESEARFRVMAETVPDILFTCTPDGHFDYVNSRFTNYTGCTAESATTISWISLIHPQELEPQQKAWGNSLHTKSPFEAEMRLRRADGAYRWCIGRAHPIHLEGGIVKWVGSINDIHDIKEAEAALRRAHDELEQRVQERTAELVQTNQELQEEIRERRRTETELAEVRRRLSRSREAERMHLARELHDGPLQEITGIQFGLSALSLSLQGVEAVAEVERTQRMLKGISGTLRQLCNDLRPPVLAHFGLHAAVRSFVEEFSHTHSDISVTYDIGGTEEPLPEEISLTVYRICQQALHNIVQHARANNVHVHLHTGKSELVLEVEDDGIGFDVPEHWVQLARAGHLGVAGMAERAESVNGRLIIDSAPGEGTRIRLHLPQD